MTHTWASVSPSVAANCRLSGLVIYFWSWNLFSKPLRCRLEKTARDHERLRLLDPPLTTEALPRSDVDRCTPSDGSTARRQTFDINIEVYHVYCSVCGIGLFNEK